MSGSLCYLSSTGGNSVAESVGRTGQEPAEMDDAAVMKTHLNGLGGQRHEV